MINPFDDFDGYPQPRFELGITVYWTEKAFGDPNDTSFAVYYGKVSLIYGKDDVFKYEVRSIPDSELLGIIPEDRLYYSQVEAVQARFKQERKEKDADTEL